ncbi:adenosine deaminase [Treponema paraluiscuniculi Cuniculi A]|uniref:Adenosine deaminase n=2 Tax=Treponema paraluiscuniculi TaxID=53435 RepID=F7XRN7_TREPU|nr:adenosine deaminase [Treponema paraluiscuniculi]AEH39999.1 adenosine deaminase [Treponema paraluiscuniculi Cuniculi A]WKC71932.1 adenosine deaminase [Treponema paraluiscuniculi]
MRSLEYYRSQPKADVHTHLNLSMKYERYKQWSGVVIPNFPRKMRGLDEMHEIIGEYTRPQCKTAQDVLNLFTMSIEDAIADNVVVMETSVDIGFVTHYEENLDHFLCDLSDLHRRYKRNVTLHFELGISKIRERSFVEQWAEPMMRSGIFENIDLYGPEISEGIEDFIYIFKLAEKYHLKKKAHVGEFSDAQSVRHFVEIFNLDEVQHGIGAATDENVLRFLAERKVRCNVCPTSNVMLNAVECLEKHPIKKMMDAGVRVGLGTDDLLFFGKTNSEQLFDMVSCGLITELHAEALLAVR